MPIVIYSSQVIASAIAGDLSDVKRLVSLGGGLESPQAVVASSFAARQSTEFYW